MFSDIEGSTRLFHDLGDRYPAALGPASDRSSATRSRCITVTKSRRRATASSSHSVDASDAVRACVDIQRCSRGGAVAAGRGDPGSHRAAHRAGRAGRRRLHRAGRASRRPCVRRWSRRPDPAVGRRGSRGRRRAPVRVFVPCARPLPAARTSTNPNRSSQVDGPGLADNHIRRCARCPPRVTTFVTRQRGSSAAARSDRSWPKLLVDNPIVTLVAQGGTGKSRLAAEVAARNGRRVSRRSDPCGTRRVARRRARAGSHR